MEGRITAEEGKVRRKEVIVQTTGAPPMPPSSTHQRSNEGKLRANAARLNMRERASATGHSRRGQPEVRSEQELPRFYSGLARARANVTVVAAAAFRLPLVAPKPNHRKRSDSRLIKRFAALRVSLSLTPDPASHPAS